MPIVATDLETRLSVKTGSAGDSTAGTALGSLGKYMSTTVPTTASLNNLFDDISGSENLASDVEYRCIFLLNDHQTLTLQSAVVWISQEYTGGAAVAIGLDPAGVVDRDSASAQAAEIADESTAPAGVSFSSPNDKGSGLAIGDIPPNDCIAIWVRRTATNSAALALDGGTLKYEGDTAP